MYFSVGIKEQTNGEEKMAKQDEQGKHLCAGDFETDPFLFNRIPEPFSWGFSDGDTYTDNFATHPKSVYIAFICTVKSYAKKTPILSIAAISITAVNSTSILFSTI